MQNKKKVENDSYNSKYGSVLERLCKIKNEKPVEKVFGRQYNRIIKELSYIIDNGYTEVLDYSYRLNSAEMKGVTSEYLQLLFHKGLGKMEYSNFDIDFTSNKEVKIGICGYTIAYVYRIVQGRHGGKKDV